MAAAPPAAFTTKDLINGLRDHATLPIIIMLSTRFPKFKKSDQFKKDIKDRNKPQEFGPYYYDIDRKKGYAPFSDFLAHTKEGKKVERGEKGDEGLLMWMAEYTKMKAKYDNKKYGEVTVLFKKAWSKYFDPVPNAHQHVVGLDAADAQVIEMLFKAVD